MNKIEIKKSFSKNITEPFIIDSAFLLSIISGNSILELGCGGGNLLEVLKNSGYRYRGIDIDDKAIKLCEEKYLDILKWDISQNLPFEDNSFDSVVSMHVLEHMENPWNLLSECNRIARKISAHIVPLGIRKCKSHKWMWNNIEELKQQFSNYTYMLVPNSDNTAIMFQGDVDKTVVSYLRAANVFTTSIEKFAPFKSFIPPKPRMRFFTGFANVDELYMHWAKKRLDNKRQLGVEPKSNTLRAIIEKKDDKVKMWFEGTPQINQFDKSVYSDIVAVLKKRVEEFILDGGVGIKEDSKLLPRVDIMELLSDDPTIESTQEIFFHIFDSPYIGMDIGNKAYSERRSRLQNFMKELSIKEFQSVPLKVINNQSELQDAVKWASTQEGSEGAMVKELDSIYEEGGLDQWCKIKNVAEIKCIVLDVEKTKDGNFVYECGVLNE